MTVLYNDPEKFDTKGLPTEYKWKGKMNHLSPIVAQKLKCFVGWMAHEDRPYELHDDFLATLTRDNYLKFRHMDSQSFSASSPSHHEPYKHQVCRILGLTTLNSLLQYVNWLVVEVCSVN